jgi:hypothetical protein
MFITKKHLPRRTFLKGAGVTLALPLLEAMIPAQTALAQTAARPYPRFVGIFYPHGMAPGHWEMPEGKLPEKLSTIMEPLQKFVTRPSFSEAFGRSLQNPRRYNGFRPRVAAAYLAANKPRKPRGPIRRFSAPQSTSRSPRRSDRTADALTSTRC